MDNLHTKVSITKTTKLEPNIWMESHNGQGVLSTRIALTYQISQLGHGSLAYTVDVSEYPQLFKQDLLTGYCYQDLTGSPTFYLSQQAVTQRWYGLDTDMLVLKTTCIDGEQVTVSVKLTYLVGFINSFERETKGQLPS